MLEKKKVALDNARILAAMAVVLLHCASGVVTYTADINSLPWWAGNFYDSISRWCVPFFVMLTGSLFLSRTPDVKIGQFYSKRLGRVIWPLLFWVNFYLFYRFRKEIITGNISVSEVWGTLVSGCAGYHLWYLWMLIGLYLFLPFLIRFAQAMDMRVCGILILLSFVLSASDSLFRWDTSTHQGLFLLWFLMYIPYLFAGYWIEKEAETLGSRALIAVFIVSLILTLLGCYFSARFAGLKAGLYFYRYLSVTVIPMSLSLYGLVLRRNRPLFGRMQEFFLQTSFGVYLVHPFIMVVVQKGLKLNPMSFHPIIGIPVFTSVVFLISVLLCWGIGRIPFLKSVIR